MDERQPSSAAGGGRARRDNPRTVDKPELIRTIQGAHLRVVGAIEHVPDERTFNDSFSRLLAALEPVTDEELFADDRWPWLGGEALVETILWDSSRHYEEHLEHLEPLWR
jgi:hypothetical protein